MKNKTNTLSLILYLILWLILLLWFWIGLQPDGAMVFSILSFYLVLPITSFIISCFWKTKKTLTKWLLPIYFGCMPMLLSYFTFSLANTITFHNLHIPDLKMALISALPSILGLLIGTIVMVFYRKNRVLL